MLRGSPLIVLFKPPHHFQDTHIPHNSPTSRNSRTSIFLARSFLSLKINRHCSIKLPSTQNPSCSHGVFRQNQLRLQHVCTRTDRGTPDASGHSNFRQTSGTKCFVARYWVRKPSSLGYFVQTVSILEVSGLEIGRTRVRLCSFPLWVGIG